MELCQGPTCRAGGMVPGSQTVVGRDRAKGYSGPGSLPRATNTGPFSFYIEGGPEINLSLIYLAASIDHHLPTGLPAYLPSASLQSYGRYLSHLLTLLFRP